MKKIFLLFSFIWVCNTFSQTINPKWVSILDLEDQRVFVDTATIKEYQNQIAVLSITYFKQPQMVESVSKEVSSVKTHLLFNLGLQKYSTVGSLYYDNKLKIIGESALPGTAGSGDVFSQPIEGNSVIANIYAYCLKFVNRSANHDEQEFSEHSERANQQIEKAAFLSKIKNAQPVQENKQDKKSEPAQDNSSIKIVDKQTQLNENAITKIADKKPKEDEGGLETNPKSTIFSDGSKFSFQVSSWKNKSKAISEMNKLKAQGHNAFIVESFVREKRGTWYRVRIGYFNSLEETESYQKKLN